MFKKKGFTLQELLITVAIIGIVAAICAPALVGMMPDETKSKYLKVYTTLSTLTAEILDDPSLYWTTYSNYGDPECSGLYCDDAPKIAPYDGDNDFSSLTKFPMILSKKLNLAGEVDKTGHSVDFYTQDGVLWSFESQIGSDLDVPGYKVMLTHLIINLEPDKNNSCSYSSDCINPNEFKFEIENDGGIKAADALGMVFLQNAVDLNSTKEDRALAAEVVSKAGSSDDIEKMAEALNEIKNKEESKD